MVRLMKTYTIYKPLDLIGDDEAQAEKLVLVRDGFSWSAFFMSVLWLFYHGMWLVLFLFVSVFVVLDLILIMIDVSSAIYSVLFLALLFLFALEASRLRHWHLLRNDYEEVAVIAGKSLREAEYKFFSSYWPLISDEREKDRERTWRMPSSDDEPMGLIGFGKASF